MKLFFMRKSYKPKKSDLSMNIVETSISSNFIERKQKNQIKNLKNVTFQ